MLIAVDIGNSSIDLGVFDDSGILIMKSKISAVKTKSADEYAVIINGILNLNQINAEKITGGIISSVVPPLTVTIASAVNKLFGIKPSEVGPGIKTGLKIKIDSQSQLGADIVSNSVAAISKFSSPVIVIDIGTATTFTVINKDETLEGVIIIPGIRLSLDALSTYTSELPDVSITKPKRIIAKNSQESMNAGVLFGHAFMIDGFIEKIKNELKTKEINIAATGGLADIVLPYCNSRIEYIPNLTLYGLRILYLKNNK